ncbi:putative lipase NDAI_0B03320 [Naumovozyma dairenensis CBS 421]|uniref:DUF676 domain-containing protein n=1 Tax=Naumovozyma dairenensis (strain ATCC 10597 / BCRC 20456 / CBS 421 / NBRC 0211 / NRRL Y-12639) TaxID=1071378 RepID=G0W6F5_NAUDC|nr:hypothetical protein NDAI_0B03320 [Naumovozyma dairenensis CBS 421]CCD23366.1 hypothetical protein NDAI_0B03320 [Naumovozyma dairenensis CBS 421]
MGIRPEPLYQDESQLKIGEIERYIITYDLYQGDDLPPALNLNPLQLTLKNLSISSSRATYLMGPFTLYCHLITDSYNHKKRIISSLDKPQYVSNLQPQCKFESTLSLNQIKRQYVWILDVVSQLIFTTTLCVPFILTINYSGSFQSSCSLNGKNVGPSSLHVRKLDVHDLWDPYVQMPLVSREQQGEAKREEYIHLVILTHGMHSNNTADMFYMMEQLRGINDRSPEDNHEKIVIDGFNGNVCETELGIKYLGEKLAKHIVNDLYNDRIVKISFIGHSLGGLIQSFAIAYITIVYPWFFKSVVPINFIALATPFLGVVTDNPKYVKVILSSGAVGKTGHELALLKDSQNENILHLLSGEPLITILSKFKNRTIYANYMNDGIVPLHTSSLLFLDYNEIMQELRKRGVQSKRLSSVSSRWRLRKSKKEEYTLPKASVLQSMKTILVPPDPDDEFVCNPDARETVIIHDKVYTNEDVERILLDYEKLQSSSPNTEGEQEDRDPRGKDIRVLEKFIQKGLNGKSKHAALVIDIARRWHFPELPWRKVIVNIKPEAHNSIIVRRRFSNAYGWEVIDHLIEAHFPEDTKEIGDTSETINALQAVTSTDHNGKQELEPNKLFSWLTKVETTRTHHGGLLSRSTKFFDSRNKDRIA